MSGAVSFCVFGPDPEGIYYGGAVQNAKDYADHYPENRLVYYVGDTVPLSVRTTIHNVNTNAVVIPVHEPEDQTATWWRLRALKDAGDTDYVMFRDVDSRLSARQMLAEDEWLDSTYSYHVMRDHDAHGVVLLAGLWGLKRRAYSDLANLPPVVTDDHYQIDQEFLLRHVWPHAKRKVMTHIGCQWSFEKKAQRRPFKIPRAPGQFVGQGVYADGAPRFPEHLGEKWVDSDDRVRKMGMFLDKY